MILNRIGFVLLISTYMMVGCVTNKTVVAQARKQSNNPNQTVQNVTTYKDQNETKSFSVMDAKEVKLPEIESKNVEIIELDLTLADEIVNLAKENIGIKYRSGGTSATGMDCSGMVYATFKKKDITVPRSSGDLARHGYKISKGEARPGDLIFFKTNGRSVINHVGIVTEITENDIKFVHASVHRGVIISSLSEAYYTKAFVQINRVID
jgi:cell wall-associated NlpC family hydrolase